MSFISNLFDEVAKDGKLLTTYVITQAPAITSFPGLSTAFHTAVADHTSAAYLDLSIQALMAIAAAIKAKKLVVAAANKS